MLSIMALFLITSVNILLTGIFTSTSIQNFIKYSAVGATAVGKLFKQRQGLDHIGWRLSFSIATILVFFCLINLFHVKQIRFYLENSFQLFSLWILGQILHFGILVYVRYNPVHNLLILEFSYCQITYVT